MKIRIMNIEDYVQVHHLWMNTKGLGLTNIDDSENGIRKYLNRNPSTCFVAEEGNNIVGVILAGHDGRRGFIYHMAVDAKLQRQGIGKDLLNHAQHALRKEGIPKVALVALIDNKVGNAFWEKEGFLERKDLTYRSFALQDIENVYT